MARMKQIGFLYAISPICWMMRICSYEFDVILVEKDTLGNVRTLYNVIVE